MKVLTKFEVATDQGIAKVVRMDQPGAPITQYRVTDVAGGVVFLVGPVQGPAEPVLLVVPNFIQLRVRDSARFGDTFSLSWVTSYLLAKLEG